jgi:glycosyltransferase involved in cell wall biosynthesis
MLGSNIIGNIVILSKKWKIMAVMSEERIDRVKISVFRVVLRALALLGAYHIIADYCARHVVEIDNGMKRPLSNLKKNDAKTTVLVLDYDRFRGDVDLFSRAEDMRILSISWNLLRFLLAAYVYLPTEQEVRALPPGRMSRTDFALAGPGSRTYHEREGYRRFLRRFLPVLMDQLGVDVVMNSDFRYRREADFVRVAAEAGYPHICYYREAMYIVPTYYHFAVERHQAFAPFHGDLIAVQNEITRRMFLDSGIAAADKIVIRGCPRMDAFVTKLDVKPQSWPRNRRQIAFFSNQRKTTLKDYSRFDLFSTSRKVARALAELAREDPKLHVVFKVKDMHIDQLNDLEDEIHQCMGNGVWPANIEFVTERMAAHDVIAKSDIVCAMQSTVVLEAAVAGKPVILPHFREMREQKGADEALMYREHRDLFDVPDDAEALKELVRQRLAQPDIATDVMARRRALFEQHVSPLNGSATEISLALIREVAGRGRALRTDNTGRETTHTHEIHQ